MTLNQEEACLKGYCDIQKCRIAFSNVFGFIKQRCRPILPLGERFVGSFYSQEKVLLEVTSKQKHIYSSAFYAINKLCNGSAKHWFCIIV